MGFKTILVPIEQHHRMNATLETALLLARKFDSYIEGFALRVELATAFAVGDVAAVPIPALEQDIATNEQQSRALSSTLCKRRVCGEATQRPSQAVGWTMPPRATTLSAATAGSST